jgi:dihydrofolate synthase/folylpolyglutamate synthase
MITREDLSSLVIKIKPTIEKYNRNSPYGPLSFFEVYTALAFTYFKEKKVDFAVLETGLGGRLDATNTVNPLVCAITPISYEHTQKLGNTLREITFEKAGIIKSLVTLPCRQAGRHSSPCLAGRQVVTRRQLIVISAPQEKEAMRVIQNRCAKVKAKLYIVGKDIIYKKNKNSFDIKGILREYTNLKIRLLGEHQFINAAVAVGIIEALSFYDIKIGAATIKKGLYSTLWPGRCEVISRNPLVVLDGAQNIASACAIKDTIRENFRYKKIILVFGISKDKDIKGVCRVFSGLPDTVILTKANNPRAALTEALKSNFSPKSTFITQGVKEARKLAYQMAGKKDLVLVTGSLFIVGEFRNAKK